MRLAKKVLAACNLTIFQGKYYENKAERKNQQNFHLLANGEDQKKGSTIILHTSLRKASIGKSIVWKDVNFHSLFYEHVKYCGWFLIIKT